MDGGPLSDWYTQLNQAPWTPPNPVFGISWSIIMVCFAFYMTDLIKQNITPSFIWIIYAIQWILNTGWNYVFFNQQQSFLGLITILLLFAIVCFLLFKFYKELNMRCYSCTNGTYFLEPTYFQGGILNFKEFQLRVYGIKVMIGNPIVVGVGGQILRCLSQNVQ